MKSVKNLLVPFIILVALVIGVIVYYAVDKFRNNEPSETSAVSYDILYYNPSDIMSLSVFERKSGHSSLVNCQMDANNNIFYSYAGDDAEPGAGYSQYKLFEYVCGLTSFYSNALVSKNGNFADFGLDEPVYTISIKTVNGTDTKVYLGNRSPDGNYCYMFVEGSKDIYMVSADKLIQAGKTALNFLDPIVLDVDYSELSTVHFDRTTDGLSLDASVSLTADGAASLKIIKPYSHPASSYFENMINKITSLNISEYIDIGEGGLKEYGLDKPAYHFVLNLKSGEKKDLYFSKLINGYYYGYIDGNGNYFALNEYQLENLDMMETVLIDPVIFHYSPSEISSVTGTYNDKSFKLSLSVSEDKSITSEGSTVELDGRNAKITDTSGRSYSSVLFESIVGIKIGGIDTNASVNMNQDPVLTLSFIGKNYETTVYSFYTRDDDSFYVVKDGEYLDFYVYSREIFYDGGYDTYNYGYWAAYELLNEAISGNVGGVYDMPYEQ